MTPIRKYQLFSRFLYTCLTIMLCLSSAYSQIIGVPDGYAAYAGTTGGGEATPVTVTTPEAFRSAVGNSTPAVIIVDGRLEVGTVSIGSNKTIIGADSLSGLYGGTIRLGGSNYIIQNLIIGPYTGDDAMEVTGATKVFIHQCEFYDGADGNLDIVRASDYVTVSWCKFYYVIQTTHKNTVLIGNGDDVTTDAGKLHVTMHHCWFGEGCTSRMPRVRYGHVHIYNNYYSCTANNYCIGAGYQCHIRVENSCFDGVNDPWEEGGALTSGGELGWDNLKFINCSQPDVMPNSYPVFMVPYPFTLDPVNSVKAMVRAGSGNVFGYDYDSSFTLTITSPAEGDKFTNGSTIMIEADASLNEGSIVSVQFFSDTLLGTDTDTPYAFIWDNVPTGFYYLLATATDDAGRKVYAKGITVFAGSGVSITQPADGSKYTLPPDIVIEVTAWDENGTISEVEFFHDDNSLGTDTEPPYAITWNNVPPGTYTLVARATDNDNNIYVSDAVNIIIPGGPEGYEYCSADGEVCSYEGMYHIAYGADGHFNYLYNVTGSVDCSSEVFGDPIYGVAKGCWIQAAYIPYVTVTYPHSGSYFKAPATITITADAIDNDGTVDSVGFYQNGEMLGVSYSEPYAFLWDKVNGGEYSITAVATDNDGNAAVSEAVTITVVGQTGMNTHDKPVMEIYPNPVSAELMIHMNDNYPGKRFVILYNDLGEAIMEDTFSDREHVLDLSSFPEGIYVITVSGEEGSILRKIIKN